MRNATRFKQIFDREIKTLADHYGVGPEATMVQLTCQIVNTFERIQAYTFYSIELMPSGEVRPMEPNVILASFPFSSPDVTFFPLVLAFYILCEEMQDVITDGYAEYFVSAGFLNLFDWLTIGMLLLLWLFESIYVGSIPAVNTVWQIRLDSFWTLGTVQAHWQTILGLACFSMITKGLKFTKNVPVMCEIGNTFAHALFPVGMLLLVVFFLLFAFAVVFQIKFSVSQMNSFDSLGTSLFSVFRGLLGDIDTSGIYAASRTFGPILFSLYVTVVLFVAFTVLIALICDSFNAVSEIQPTDGVVVSLLAWRNARSNRGGDESQEEDEPATEKVEALGLKQQGPQLDPAAGLEQIIQALRDEVQEQQHAMSHRLQAMEKRHEQQSAQIEAGLLHVGRILLEMKSSCQGPKEGSHEPGAATGRTMEQDRHAVPGKDTNKCAETSMIVSANPVRNDHATNARTKLPDVLVDI
eukprot:TRINITY_DN381_c0_g1_i12.p2 TRINITY_DN381_c0_g1~~TRINITY_DN381_c0_g1_i12.p2  ORF type:complete len:468 (+),score=68.33 TRINITY_DN381_c0_g1_i12:1580-2983(+)